MSKDIAKKNPSCYIKVYKQKCEVYDDTINVNLYLGMHKRISLEYSYKLELAVFTPIYDIKVLLP